MKLLIIGGVAGGATAAARARRLNEDAEIVVFERGEYISFANCGLPYYIGDVIKKRDKLLVTTVDEFKKRYSKMNPMKRMLNELDLFPPVEFLLNNPLAAITGQNIQIDGGWTVW